MSPTASYACNSNVYDVQSEKLFAREVKSSSSSRCPWALRHAPRTLTGSLRDQSARRGAASPLCRASSASYRVVLTQVRKSSRSVMPQSAPGQRFAPRENRSISARQRSPPGDSASFRLLPQVREARCCSSLAITMDELQASQVLAPLADFAHCDSEDRSSRLACPATATRAVSESRRSITSRSRTRVVSKLRRPLSVGVDLSGGAQVGPR